MAARHARVEWPDWLPTETQNYLKHTMAGISIRRLARSEGVHASTILRQIRRIEQRRDDPLLEAAFQVLCESTPRPDISDLDLIQALRKLSEQGAILAISAEMEKAVIVRNMGEDGPVDTASISRRIPEVLILRDWISAVTMTGRIGRYRITASGRAGMRDLIARQENRARALAEETAPFRGRSNAKEARPRRRSLNMESPVQQLARRREKDGSMFLDQRMVRAAERLREDFEIACFGEIIVDEMANVTQILARPSNNQSVNDAKSRTADAFEALGPGLSDVALRCCCLLEGMEQVEKEMGWSARSGKIVLRIALQRLVLHQEEAGKASPMIG